ncbi:hypothetical protein [Blautia sp. An249]|uniref:hypothetical protein n=1 Tax=Blautia sp. An249 TaxID=1965603 RepID=UPI0013A6049B|nr:hypothetical protein [Blautia sp. An249]
MISKEQIAHDLAVAKLYGSRLSNEELCKEYNRYFKEILACLTNNTTAKPTQIINSPM